MEIQVLQLGMLQTNCYVVWGEQSQTCVVIDPGDQANRVQDTLEKLGKTPEAILLTHGHFDHVGAVRVLVAEYACPVYLCQADLALPPRMTGGELYCTHNYQEGDSLPLAGLRFTVLHTPGHTPGCVCLQCEDALFTGDTLFAGSIGRTDFPGSSPEQMAQSLKRLTRIPKNYRIFPGHGEDSTLDEERRSNPFL